MQHFNYIDRLKGYAILIVVIGHITLFSLKAGNSITFLTLQSFEMQLFMFLSGLVISTPPNLTKFKTKALRYMVPWFVFGSFLNFCIYPDRVIEACGKGAVQLLIGLSQGPWYLLTLTIFVFTLVPLSFLKKRNFLVELLLVVFFYILFRVGWNIGGVPSQVLRLQWAATFYPYFMLGYWARKYNLVSWLLQRKWLFTLAITAFFLLQCTDIRTFSKPHIVEFACAYIVPLSAIVVCVYAAAQRENKDSAIERHFAMIGRHTLGIYVLHGCVAKNTDLTMFSPFFANGNNQFLLFVLVLVISYAILWGCICFERLVSVSETLHVWLFGGGKGRKL